MAEGGERGEEYRGVRGFHETLLMSLSQVGREAGKVQSDARLIGALLRSQIGAEGNLNIVRAHYATQHDLLVNWTALIRKSLS